MADTDQQQADLLQQQQSADKAAADKAAADRAAADKAAAAPPARPKAKGKASEPVGDPGDVVAVLTTSSLWHDGDQLPRGRVVRASAERFAHLSAREPSKARLATPDETPADVSTLPHIG